MAEVLYMQVADHILSGIQDGSLKEHDKLSERKLAEVYQVSRTVVREAIKLLNERGLVQTVYGKGSFVHIPDYKALMNKFEDALDISRVQQQDVVEARELIEIAMIPLIVARVNAKDLTVLHELYQDMKDSVEDGEKFMQADEKFHLALSICAHNQVMSVVTGTMNNMSDRKRLLRSRNIRLNANKEHRKIIEALEQRDEIMLREAIEKHINCIRSHTSQIGNA